MRPRAGARTVALSRLKPSRDELGLELLDLRLGLLELELGGGVDLGELGELPEAQPAQREPGLQLFHLGRVEGRIDLEQDVPFLDFLLLLDLDLRHLAAHLGCDVDDPGRRPRLDAGRRQVLEAGQEPQQDDHSDDEGDQLEGPIPRQQLELEEEQVDEPCVEQRDHDHGPFLLRSSRRARGEDPCAG